MRIALASCSADDLWEYTKSRQPYVDRRELIFAAGALNNRKLRSQLGSMEAARWDEGRRAADPEYTNPYFDSPHSTT